MDIEKILESPRSRSTSRYIAAHYPEEYKQIKQLPGDSFSEQLYRYIYGEKDHKCPICSKDAPFRNILIGYSTYCSTECSYKDKERMNKIKNTMLNRYGVENASQSVEILEKKKQIMDKKWGGAGFGSKIIAAKSSQTILDRYGVENVSCVEEIKERKKQTTQKHYGVDCSLQIPDVRRKIKPSLIAKYGEGFWKNVNKKSRISIQQKMLDIHTDLLRFEDDGRWVMRCPHPNCTKCTEKQYTTDQGMYHDRLRWGSETCTKLLSPGSTNQGTTLELFIRNILDEYDIEYLTNARDIISPLELDIYIPSKRIAIECNGSYWHSSHPSTYHMEKFKKCQQQGIQLLTIWDDWIKNKSEIVTSILLSKLGLIHNAIYARKCEIKEISSADCSKFLNINHIQGSCKSSIRLGLIYKEDLVAVMCFSKRSKLSGSKKMMDNEWELIRFCNKLNTRVIGAACRLMRCFIQNYHPKQITSFSCNDISDGRLYKTMGFIQKNISPSYWYIKQGSLQRYHRSSFTKQAIRKKFPKVYKEGLTETEMMLQLPYWRIYDSGVIKWIYNLDSNEIKKHS